MSDRLVELLVKEDLRNIIKKKKKDKTYDEFLRNLMKKGNE